MNFGADGRSVNVSNSGVQILHGLKSVINIAGINGARKPVFGIVADLNCLIKTTATQNGNYRSKNLLFCNLHLWIYISKNRWCVKITMIIGSSTQALTTAKQLRSFLPAAVHIIINLI